MASKEIGLEVNVDKTKFMVLSGDQNVGRSHGVKIDNSSFERGEEFKYLGTNLINQNFKKTKSRLNSRDACYHSVQDHLSSSVLSKKLKIKFHIAVILPVVLYGCETWLLFFFGRGGNVG